MLNDDGWLGSVALGCGTHVSWNVTDELSMCAWKSVTTSVVYLLFVIGENKNSLLSPFTKDYRGEGHSNEPIGQFLGGLARLGEA